MYGREDEIAALLDEQRRVVEPDEYRRFEERIRRSVVLAGLPGPEGDTERLRLDLLLRLRDLPPDAIERLGHRVAELVEHRPPDATNRPD